LILPHQADWILEDGINRSQHMILVVLADAWEVYDYINPMFSKVLGRADSIEYSV
jgi:hypothetical protein